MRFDITNPQTNETRYAVLSDYLNPSQMRSFAGNPGMNLQFAHHLKDLVKEHAGFTPKVTALVDVSLNGRKKEKLVEKDLDLAEIPRFHPSYLWVTEFQE